MSDNTENADRLGVMPSKRIIRVWKWVRDTFCLADDGSVYRWTPDDADPANDKWVRVNG